MNRIFLVEVTGYDPGTAAEVVWRFCSGDGFRTGSADYIPRIENPGLYSRSIATSEFGGRQAVSYGEVTLVNIDGELDGMADQFFDGRELVLKIVDSAKRLDAAVMILRAHIEAVAVERERVSIRLRDRATTLDRPFSVSKYLGNNTLPHGVEGTADDLKDKQKIRIFGRIALMQPVLVNTSKLIYQVNDGPVDAILNVFDAGAYLDAIREDYVSLDDLETSEPAPGAFRCYSAGGYFRLGAQPFGEITACVAESLHPSQVSAAGLLRRVMAAASNGLADSMAPRAGADWDEFGLQALDARNAGSLGLMVGDDETLLALLDRICASVGAFWGFDALGALTVVRLDEPAATAAMTLTMDDCTAFERTPEGQYAYWRVSLTADSNYAVQNKTALAGVVSPARANWFINATRTQQASDPALTSQRKLAQDLTAETLFNGIGTAAAEAQRRLNLFAARRDVVTVTVGSPLRFGRALDIGQTIRLIAPRLGYTEGKRFLCIGVSLDYGRNQADLTLWG